MHLSYHRYILHDMQLNNVFLDWLHNRKISDKVIYDFNLCTKNNRLVIPIHLPDGSFSFNKYRRSPLEESGPKYTYDKGGKLTLYGADKIYTADTVLICEGEMDSLVAWSHNIPAVSGTGGAMSFNPEWVSLFNNKRVIICFDNDAAGGEGMAKIFSLLPQSWVLFLPDKPGIKDISDYVTHGGNLHDLIKTAKHFAATEDIIADKVERESHWRSVYFHEAYLRNLKKNSETEIKKQNQTKLRKRIAAGLERAKQYPIPELLKLDSSGATQCLWHAETKASLYYYKNSNKLWCFGGCGRGYDSIDVYQKIHGVSFIEAVKALQ